MVVIRSVVVAVVCLASHAVWADRAATCAERAAVLDAGGAYADELAALDGCLAEAPRSLPLLLQRAVVLVKLARYADACDAYKAYLAAGAVGANRERALGLTRDLCPAKTTLLDVTVSNGPATIHLDWKSGPALCVAAPGCRKSWLPGNHQVIAERPGFVTWSSNVNLARGTTTKVAITLVEQPSALVVHAPPGAAVRVDGAPHTGGVLPPGAHQVEVTKPGHVPVRREVVAAEGKPIDLEVALVARTAVHAPPGAALRLDDKPLVLADGGVELAPGPHVLTARARGFVDARVAIPAARPPDYAIDIVLAPIPPPGSRFTLRRKLGLAAGGVAVAALAGGVALGVSSGHLDDDAYKRCPSVSEPCARAAEATELNQRGQTRALQANILYGVAAGAAVGAAVLWLTGAPERLSVAPRSNGIDVAVRF